jgi:hypothetical protein
VFLFFFSVLALLVLDSFLDNFDFAVLTRPACNSVDFLTESLFEIWCFFSLCSFSLAIFFQLPAALRDMGVRLAVGAIHRTRLRICFLATFCDTFLRFCKLVFFLVVRSLSLCFLATFCDTFLRFCKLVFFWLCGHCHCRHALLPGAFHFV